MKKYLCTALAAAMLLSGTVTAGAADIEKRDAQLRPDVTIIIDDDTTYFRSASGDYLYPILFNGSTYLPLRSIGEIMGKNVNWDEETKTVTLDGTRDTYKNTSKPSSDRKEDIEIQIRKDFKIIIDGKEQKFKDANGDRVYPILYNGSTYLPLRAIGEIMNNDVLWDGDEMTVTLKESGLTVTDADSFNSETGKVTGVLDKLDEIKQKILDDAGISGTVEFIKIEKDFEDGTWRYEIEFVYDGIEYDYEIEIITGRIISKKTEIAKEYTNSNEKDLISAEKAREIAMKDAKVSEKDVKSIKTKLDEDDGSYIYEVEFKCNGWEYEYEINAETGRIIDKEADYDD